MTEAGVVWITGGGSGIGRALAVALAARGWQVAISGRRAEALAETVHGAATGRVFAYSLDVTDTKAVSETVGRIERNLGPITLAILNAGIGRSKSGVVEVDNYALHMDVNYLGVVRGVAALLPGMRARRRGHIVVVSSLAGYRGLPGVAPYAASKAALNSLAEALQCEFARDGIRVSLVTPGFVATPMTADTRFPRPFMISADKAAAAILRGIRRKRFRIAFPWQMIVLSRLQRLLPDVLYFRLMGSRRRD